MTCLRVGQPGRVPCGQPSITVGTEATLQGSATTAGARERRGPGGVLILLAEDGWDSACLADHLDGGDVGRAARPGAVARGWGRR